MKATRGILTGLLLITGLIVGLHFLHAQQIETSYPSNTFWLSVSNISGGQINFVLQNTLPGSNYILLQKQHLTDSSWSTAGTTTGASNQSWTAMSAPLSGQSSAFFEAVMTAGQTITNANTNLWLVVPTNTLATPGLLTLIISNTVQGQPYVVQTNSNLANSSLWNVQQSVSGGMGSSTTVQVPMNGPVLFVLAAFGGDSTGNGLPDWWQLQYFGHTGVDPNALDSANDGWTVYQKYAMGVAPSVFITPPTPQGVTVNNDLATGQATVSWPPSSGPVTGYIVEKIDSYTGTTNDFNVSANSTFFGDTIAQNTPDPNNRNNYDVIYSVMAEYAGGNSAWSTPVPLQQGVVGGAIVPGTNGTTYLAASGLPVDTAVVRVSGGSFSNDIPVSAFTNGIYLLPASWPAYSIYYIQSVATNGNTSANMWLSPWYVSYYDSSGNFLGGWVSTITEWGRPFYDGRVQLKQNLAFLLRAATTSRIFSYYPTNYSTAAGITGNYAFASYVLVGTPMYGNAEATEDFLLPFEMNYFYRNFVYDTGAMNSNGVVTNGINYSNSVNNGFYFLDNPTYQFQAPTNGVTNFTALLGTNQTRWLAAGDYILGRSRDTLGITFNSNKTISLSNSANNIYGLPFLSAQIAQVSLFNGLQPIDYLAAGSSVPMDQYVIRWAYYPETAQPQYQTVEYDFWAPVDEFDYQNAFSESWYLRAPLDASRASTGYQWKDTAICWDDLIPGMDGFSPTNTSRLMIMPVGQQIKIVGYAKLALLNGYTNIFAYLGQYFDQAYQIDASGNTTTNTTGVLSPYGDFFSTVAGPAVLLTMPDIDTGQRGTCTVYCVNVVFDRSQGSNMDVSFGGADATSANNPAQIWVNDNYDRWTWDFLGGANEQDDLETASVPDCQYTTNSLPAIPCPRDLEDYFRLWTPGVAALMKVLPTNYTVQLTLSGNGQIRIFQAVEPDGGTNYLFDEATASNQVANATSLYVGLLTSSSPVTLPIQTNFNEHFIFCGAQTGSAQIDLQILDPNQNVVADAPAYLQINEIKQMYERWTVGDNPNVAPYSVPEPVTDGLAAGVPKFEYPPPTDTNTPYILFVHGWNMEPWEKDRFAESAFKRLYWQGYQGRFGEFRWPTYFDFPLGSWSWQAIDPRNYDKSESNAWTSVTGLLNKLNDLNAEYPGRVFLIAHSMGNVVAGEALRLAGTNRVVNTYAALQGALAARAYDPTTPVRDASASTPDYYASYWTNGAPCYFNNTGSAGTYVNFFNTNDWALTQLWPLDQGGKPDHHSWDYPGYYYSVSSLHPFGFYAQYGSGTNDFHNFYFPGDTYTIFAFCDEASSYALGSQGGVAGVFATAKQIDLKLDPYDFGGNHVDHSGEFRSDNARRGSFWNIVLVQTKLK